MTPCLDHNQIATLAEELVPNPHEAILHVSSCDVCKQALHDVIELQRLLQHTVPVEPTQVERLVSMLRRDRQHTTVAGRRLTTALEIGLSGCLAAAVLALVTDGGAWMQSPAGPGPVASTIVSVAWAVITFSYRRRTADQGAAL